MSGIRGRPLRDPSGQAAIEVLGITPLLAVVVLGAAQLLAAGAAHELAGNAAGAGAAALLQGLDAEGAARDAVPGWSRSRVDVVVRGDEVRVRLRPVAIVPGIAGLLATEVSATAGSATAGSASAARPARTLADAERTERMRPGARAPRGRDSVREALP